MPNIYGSSTATMVAQTHLTVTLYVHLLSCYALKLRLTQTTFQGSSYLCLLIYR
jgi:hypothetical protein